MSRRPATRESDQLLTPEEVEQIYKISKATQAAMRSKGLLPFVQVQSSRLQKRPALSVRPARQRTSGSSAALIRTPTRMATGSRAPQSSATVTASCAWAAV
jgi:hypothetical protein